MKTLRIAALPIAAALVLTACSSSSDSGTTSSSSAAAPTTASSSATSSSATSSSATSTSSASATSISADTADTSVTPADLDAESEAWFSTFCGSLTGVIPQVAAAQAVVESATQTGGASSTSPQEAQQAGAAAYSAAGQAMTDLVSSLSATPPPGIENGAQLAAAAVTAFQAFGDTLTKAGSDLAAATITTQEELSTTVTAINAQIEAAGDGINQAMGGTADLPADVEAAVEQLPACSFLSSGGADATTTS